MHSPDRERQDAGMRPQEREQQECDAVRQAVLWTHTCEHVSWAAYVRELDLQLNVELATRVKVGNGQ